MHDELIIQDAYEHNFKDASLELPRGSMIVFTGPSGSGGLSLAFDTILAEGQCRHVESLSSYIRQFLGQMDKSGVDFIESLLSAVSIDQKSTSHNPRSTVGTITETHGCPCLLYACAGVVHHPGYGARTQAQTPQQIVDRIHTMDEGTRSQVLSSAMRGRKGEYQDLIDELRSEGYTRAVVDDEMIRLKNASELEKELKYMIEIVVDRFVVREGIRQRLTDPVETALCLSDGLVIIDCASLDAEDPGRRRRSSKKRSCLNDHPLMLDETKPRTFSFSAPYDACPDCAGPGLRLEIGPEPVVPDEEFSLADGVVISWNPNLEYHKELLESFSKELGFAMDTPWKFLPKKVKDTVLYGKDYETTVKFRNRWNRERSYTVGLEGAVKYIECKHEETEFTAISEKFGSYMRETLRPTCHGVRLRPEVLAVRISNKSIAKPSDMSITDVHAFLTDVELEQCARSITVPIFMEIEARLASLIDVSPTYLTLLHGTGTFSGGGVQHIRLIMQIDSDLVGIPYALDGSSTGLHQRDNRKLIATLECLRDLGNTFIVTEHGEETIGVADRVVDIGPDAGRTGGWVVHSGPLSELLENRKSLTGQHLSGKRRIVLPPTHRLTDRKRVATVKGAHESNLKNVDVLFPLGMLTAVTGVSSSGKSTLVNDILCRVPILRLSGVCMVPGRHCTIIGIKQFDKAAHVG